MNRLHNQIAEQQHVPGDRRHLKQPRWHRDIGRLPYSIYVRMYGPR